MNIIKHMLYIGLLFIGYNAHAMYSFSLSSASSSSSSSEEERMDLALQGDITDKYSQPHDSLEEESMNLDLQVDIIDRYSQLRGYLKFTANEEAAKLSDEEHQIEFLAAVNSEETREELLMQATYDVAAFRLIPSNQLKNTGIQHTSPQKPKPNKTLPSSRASTRRKKPSTNTPTAKRQLDFD